MKANLANKYFAVPAMAVLVVAGAFLGLSGSAMAQDTSTMAPPNVLVIEQEVLKPGTEGMAHQKSESSFVQTMQGAKSPIHYFAATSMSGPSRALFFIGFDSFAEWGSSVAAMMNNSSLSTEFDNDLQADGKLLKDHMTGVFLYRPKMSINPNIDISTMRYMTITVIHIKPGHGEEWKQLIKLHNQVYGKVPGTHAAIWQGVYGDEGGLFLVTQPMRSLAELDTRRAANKKAWKAVSAEQQKKMDDLVASAFASIHTNLYSFDPKMSYVPDRWKTSSPDYWGK